MRRIGAPVTASIDNTFYKKRLSIEPDIEEAKKLKPQYEINREANFLPSLRSNFRRSPTKKILERLSTTKKKNPWASSEVRSPDKISIKFHI